MPQLPFVPGPNGADDLCEQCGRSLTVCVGPVCVSGRRRPGESMGSQIAKFGLGALVLFGVAKAFRII